MPKKENMSYIEGSYSEIESQMSLDGFSARSRERFKAMLQPGVEIHPDHKVAFFGAQYLHQALENIDQGMPVTLEVGMSANIAPTPAWFAYLEMGIQRLAELRALDVKGGIRFFSTASLQIVRDCEKQKKREQLQKQQAMLAKQYFRLFHPDLLGIINLDGLTQTLELPPNIAELEVEARSLLNQNNIESFDSMAKNHGEEDAPVNPLQYALMHNDARAFGDDPLKKGQRVAIGCASERAFNQSRHRLHEPKAAIPGISVAVLGVLSESPPYLGWRMQSRVKHKRLLDPADPFSIGVADAAISFKELARIYGILHRYNSSAFNNDELLNIDYVLEAFYESRYDEIPGILELRYLWRCAEHFPGDIQSLIEFICNDQNKGKGYEHI